MESNENPYRSPDIGETSAGEIEPQTLNRDQCPRCTHHVDLAAVSRSMLGYKCPGCNSKLRLLMPVKIRIAYSTAIAVPSILLLVLQSTHPGSTAWIYALYFWMIMIGGSSLLMAFIVSRHGRLTAR